MKKLKVYVSGSWINRPKVKSLMGDIDIMGHEVAIDWTEQTESGPESDKLYAEEDIKALEECHCLIYCLDGNPSRGKNFEVGYMAALKKPIAIYVLNLDSITHIQMETHGIVRYYINKECVFIRAGMYSILRTMDELKSWLSNMATASNTVK